MIVVFIVGLSIGGLIGFGTFALLYASKEDKY